MSASIDAVHQFRRAMEAHGLVPPDEIVADGAIHRFSSDGRPNDDAGYYVMFPDDIPAGSYGCWRRDLKVSWCAKSWDELSPHERHSYHARIERMARMKADDLQARQDAAARKAETIWAGLSLCEDHAYLGQKQVKAHGARQFGPALVVPVRDPNGSITSLQFIGPDGDKRFLLGGRVKGCSFVIPGATENQIVCEGFATGASLYEVTGHTVHVAFNAGNLEVVVSAVRSKWPAARIVIAADDDQRTDGNPGITKATRAARLHGGYVAVPAFGADRPENATDFNDLRQLLGDEAVRQCVANAMAPDDGPPRADPSVGSVGPPAGSYGENMGWDEPLPLPCHLPPVQQFDPELLPDALRPWVVDVAERMQCPMDFPAVGAVVVLSSLIGARARVQPKRFDDWAVTPNLWGLIVGLPGVMKSPALSEVMRPLEKLEDEHRDEWQCRHDAWEVDQKAAQLLGAANEKKASKLLHDSPDAKVADLLTPVDLAPEPALRRLIVNDTSVEALCEVLECNPWGLLAHRDEIYGMLKSMDREGQEGARAFYLQAFDGDKPYTVDRIGRGLNRRIARVCVSMLGCIQPGRVNEYVRSAVAGGGGDDGLIQRFQLTVWPDITTGWKNVDRAVDMQARHVALQVYRRLASLPEPDGEAPAWRFSPLAQELFNDWRCSLEARIRTDELHPAMQAHLSKYRKLVPALALIFEMVDSPQDTMVIGKPSLRRALAWAQYLESHAYRLYAAAHNPDVVGAEALLRRLRNGSVRSQFSMRDVYLKAWKYLSTPELVRKAVKILVEYGWLRKIDRETGGRPAESYVVNPVIAGDVE